MPILTYFGKSPREGKKYLLKLVNPSKSIHFGSDVSTTYVEGADEKTKENYLKRHRVREDWTTLGPASASRHILWGESKDIKKNLADYIDRFDIKDNR